MSTFEDIRRRWQQQLKELYPSGEPGRDSREINTLFRFTLEDVFGLYTADQFVQRDLQQPPRITEKLDEVLSRLLTGEPLQHITGFTYFDDLKIRVSQDVLIPRPETEELVYWIAESLAEGFEGTIVDWCTGSGCIALALKNRFPKAHITGYDRSEAALEMAKVNGSELKLDVRFELNDALAPETISRNTDLIVSNPPYIPERDKPEMRTNVVDFEPHIALFVPDEDPQLFYKAITEKAVAALKPGGMLFFELHEDYADETKKMVERSKFREVTIREDIHGKPRMLRAVKTGL
jgi:release factor glutamine methyltransferase